MNALPLTKEIYDLAIAAGITSIVLNFQGGNDEGFLDAHVVPHSPNVSQMVYDWADNAYQYNGAGDGSDYGDTIEYNLVDSTVTTSEWQMERVEGHPDTGPMPEPEDEDCEVGT